MKGKKQNMGPLNVGVRKAQHKARALVPESAKRSAAGKKSIKHILFG